MSLWDDLFGNGCDEENGEDEYGEYGIWSDCPENYPADFPDDD